MVAPSLLTSDDIQLPLVVVNASVRVGLSGNPSCMGSRAAGCAAPAPRWAVAVIGIMTSAMATARMRSSGRRDVVGKYVANMRNPCAKKGRVAWRRGRIEGQLSGKKLMRAPIKGHGAGCRTHGDR